mmetsp:Transcript_28647/g.54848  ORF Transcript_28647/g.54848 Transcript_28647/m.54848 type:complete len:928 (+) Transcript_28647:502-3285(+)
MKWCIEPNEHDRMHRGEPNRSDTAKTETVSKDLSITALEESSSTRRASYQQMKNTDNIKLRPMWTLCCVSPSSSQQRRPPSGPASPLSPPPSVPMPQWARSGLEAQVKSPMAGESVRSMRSAGSWALSPYSRTGSATEGLRTPAGSETGRLRRRSSAVFHPLQDFLHAIRATIRRACINYNSIKTAAEYTACEELMRCLSGLEQLPEPSLWERPGLMPPPDFDVFMGRLERQGCGLAEHARNLSPVLPWEQVAGEAGDAVAATLPPDCDASPLHDRVMTCQVVGPQGLVQAPAFNLEVGLIWIAPHTSIPAHTHDSSVVFSPLLPNKGSLDARWGHVKGGRMVYSALRDMGKTVHVRRGCKCSVHTGKDPVVLLYLCQATFSLRGCLDQYLRLQPQVERVCAAVEELMRKAVADPLRHNRRPPPTPPRAAPGPGPGPGSGLRSPRSVASALMGALSFRSRRKASAGEPFVVERSPLSESLSAKAVALKAKSVSFIGAERLGLGRGCGVGPAAAQASLASEGSWSPCSSRSLSMRSRGRKSLEELATLMAAEKALAERNRRGVRVKFPRHMVAYVREECRVYPEAARSMLADISFEALLISVVEGAAGQWESLTQLLNSVRKVPKDMFSAQEEATMLAEPEPDALDLGDESVRLSDDWIAPASTPPEVQDAPQHPHGARAALTPSPAALSFIPTIPEIPDVPPVPALRVKIGKPKSPTLYMASIATATSPAPPDPPLEVTLEVVPEQAARVRLQLRVEATEAVGTSGREAADVTLRVSPPTSPSCRVSISIRPCKALNNTAASLHASSTANIVKAHVQAADCNLVTSRKMHHEQGSGDGYYSPPSRIPDLRVRISESRFPRMSDSSSVSSMVVATPNPACTNGEETTRQDCREVHVTDDELGQCKVERLSYMEMCNSPLHPLQAPNVS